MPSVEPPSTTAWARLSFGRARGDLFMIFGAAKLNLRIVENPVRYRERVYGAPNISRFADGWLLLKASARAASRLCFAA